MPHPGEAEKTLDKMAATLIHRGLDAAGMWSDRRARCFLGHRRLSIIDTSQAGRQPMTSADGRWTISFNGEIYNFLEVRRELEAEGMLFRGRTDTEVLLQAIARWGLRALPRLDGMFAFAVFDTESGELMLARDPFGEKPLYYMELPGAGLAFASELQALEQVPGFDGEVSVDSMAELLMFQYIGAPRTIYKAVKKLPPGHWLVARSGEPLRFGRYYEFRPGAHGFQDRPLAELADELEALLSQSIRRRLISDVPLGAFLSGGMDSSIVCALITKRLGLPLKTFSIGFAGAPESEHQAAEAFARHLGCEHQEQILSPDVNEFLAGIGRILDEPNADTSCMPTYLLCRFAKQHVTVAVSGDGGDEMFVGYGRYFTTLDDERACGAKRKTFDAGRAYYSERILVFGERQIEELFGHVPPSLALHLEQLRVRVTQQNEPLFCRLRMTDVENYLPGAVLAKVDRMSMQHSLEVRTPYLNVAVAKFAERLPSSRLYSAGKGKLALREVARRYLPPRLIDTPKKGFGIPMSRWAREPLLAVAASLLQGGDGRLREALGPEAIARFLRRQQEHRSFSAYQVWALVTLESWLRYHPAKVPERLPPSRALATSRVFGAATIPADDTFVQRASHEVWMEAPRKPIVFAVTFYLLVVGLCLALFRRIPSAGISKAIAARFRRPYAGDLSKLWQDDGHCFLAEVPVHLPSDYDSASRLHLLEDEHLLGPAHSSHDEIRTIGLGRYSHWGRQVYFSTSDNSDPRSNGRRYRVEELLR